MLSTLNYSRSIVWCSVGCKLSPHLNKSPFERVVSIPPRWQLELLFCLIALSWVILRSLLFWICSNCSSEMLSKYFTKTCLLVGSFESKLLVDVFGVVLSLLNQLFDSLVHLFNLASNFSLFLSEIPLYRLLFLVLASKCCLKDSLNACPVHFDLVL